MRPDQLPRFLSGSAEGLPRILSSLPLLPSHNPSERLAIATVFSNAAPTHTAPQSSDGAAVTETTHLVVHFDINETILIGDEAGGDTVDDVVNKMIAKSAFVQISSTRAAVDDTHSIVPTHWWHGELIRAESGADDATASPTLSIRDPPPLYTGWDWPPHCCPYYRTAYKAKSKTFVRHDGPPYLPLHHHIHEKVSNLHSHILPAFFRTLVELTKRSVRHTVVFRTFGSDLERVALAVSEFAVGRHPLYPDFVNPDYVLGSTKLFRGRWVQRRKTTGVSGHDLADDGEPSDDFSYQLLELPQGGGNGNVVADGDDQVLDILHSCTICGIQDDYEFWSAHGCEPWAGKPVWRKAPRERDYHHILFDDNIHNLATDSIASVRVPLTSGSVEGAASSRPYRTLTGPELLREQGIHLVRVPTIEPALNERWFLEQIDHALTTDCSFSSHG